jgi:hypothetical protein
LLAGRWRLGWWAAVEVAVVVEVVVEVAAVDELVKESREGVLVYNLAHSDTLPTYSIFDTSITIATKYCI